jgi:hypothetical protein
MAEVQRTTFSAQLPGSLRCVRANALTRRVVIGANVVLGLCKGSRDSSIDESMAIQKSWSHWQSAIFGKLTLECWRGSGGGPMTHSEHFEANSASKSHPRLGWPQGVQPISIEGLDLLGIDVESGRLYWNGRELVAKNRVSLGGLEIWLAVLATMGTLLQGIPVFADWILH